LDPKRNTLSLLRMAGVTYPPPLRLKKIISTSLHFFSLLILFFVDFFIS